MKKYVLTSLALLSTTTLVTGALLPTLLSLPGPFRTTTSPLVHERKGYFEMTGEEPYLLMEEAYRQADRVAEVRGVRVEKVRALIMRRAQIWPLNIFPPSLNVNDLNHDLDWLR